MDIILRIRELMTKKNISQDKLAKGIEKTTQTISNYLTGRTKMDIDVLIKIAIFFEVPINYFFDESEVKQALNGSNQIINNGNKQTINFKNEKIEELKQKIESLERLLQAKDEIIDLLKNK